MAVTYPTNVKNARLTAVRDLVDAGSGAGRLEIGSAGMASVLATIVLGDPCGTVTGGVLTLSGFPRSDTSADASGTAAVARLVDSDGNAVVTGLTVGLASSDLILDSIDFTAGQGITIAAVTITHAP